jgi:hypothetical protein
MWHSKNMRKNPAFASYVSDCSIFISVTPPFVQYLEALPHKNLNVKQKREVCVQSCRKEGRIRTEV